MKLPKVLRFDGNCHEFSEENTSFVFLLKYVLQPYTKAHTMLNEVSVFKELYAPIDSRQARFWCVWIIDGPWSVDMVKREPGSPYQEEKEGWKRVGNYVWTQVAESVDVQYLEEHYHSDLKDLRHEDFVQKGYPRLLDLLRYYWLDDTGVHEAWDGRRTTYGGAIHKLNNFLKYECNLPYDNVSHMLCLPHNKDDAELAMSILKTASVQI